MPIGTDRGLRAHRRWLCCPTEALLQGLRDKIHRRDGLGVRSRRSEDAGGARSDCVVRCGWRVSRVRTRDFERCAISLTHSGAYALAAVCSSPEGRAVRYRSSGFGFRPMMPRPTRSRTVQEFSPDGRLLRRPVRGEGEVPGGLIFEAVAASRLVSVAREKRLYGPGFALEGVPRPIHAPRCSG